MEYKVVLAMLVMACVAVSEAAPRQSQKPGLEHLLGRPTPGDECDPDECVLEGHCQEYWWCEREDSDHKGKGKKGEWMENRCDNEAGESNMYWNPNHNGGSCDWWENLDDATKELYNKDPACIDPHCEWKPDPNNECSGTYWYFHPDKNGGKDVELHCPSLADGEQLLWSQARKSCHHCSGVTKADGSACC